MTVNSASLNMGQCADGNAAVWHFGTKARRSVALTIAACMTLTENVLARESSSASFC